MKANVIHNSLLRGGFCALWVFGFMISFFEFLYACTADMGSPEQNMFVLHMCVCAGVGVVGAGVHAYLIHEARDKSARD
jgi:hypothetical protein